jgi:hypothetical protein
LHRLSESIEPKGLSFPFSRPPVQFFALPRHRRRVCRHSSHHSSRRPRPLHGRRSCRRLRRVLRRRRHHRRFRRGPRHSLRPW